MVTFNEQDQAVADYLKSIGVKYQPMFVANMDHDKDWKHDLFNIVMINSSGKMINTQFQTGIGNRVKRVGFIQKISCKDTIALRKIRDTLDGNQTRLPVYNDAVIPTSANVLYCLLLDMSCAEYGFNDFCDNLGYDPDSRKALDIYLQCEDITKQLKSVFTHSQIEHLQELLEDY